MHQTENNNLDPRASTLEPAFPSQQSVSTPGLIDYLQVIVNRRRMIFLTTLAATVISLIYSLFLPNIYTAKTTILPAHDDKGMMSTMIAQLGGLAALAGVSGFPIGGTTTADLYVSMLKNEAVKDPIIDRFKLMEVYKDKYRTDTYKALDKNAVINAGKKDGIITITVDDRDPKRAAEMADAYVEELEKLVIRLKVTDAGQDRTFLEERLGSARVDLAKAEENLKAFQAKNKAIQVTAQAEATIKGVAEMRAKLAAQEVQLATYRRRFTETNQEVKNLATSIRNLRAQIAKLEGGGGNSAIPSIGSVPTIGQEYVRLMREFKLQESLMEMLTKQYEMAKLSVTMNISPFQVILKAKVPERKSKPARAKMVLTVTLGALFFSLFLAFVREYFSRMAETDKQRWKGIIELRR